MARNALTLINRLAAAERQLIGQTFLAPLVGGGRVRLRLGGLLYSFVVGSATPGWWICRALDNRRAEAVEEAAPWQRGDYLRLWPALRLVLLEPLRNGAWLALPFSPSDAAQRFGMNGLMVVQLVESGRPFERVIARVEGATLWYDEQDRRADPALAEGLREALAGGREAPGLSGLGAGERAAYTLLMERSRAAQEADENARTGRRLREALEMGGARLLGYDIAEGVLRVSWERDGQRSVTLVSQALDVLSAGICLSGEEQLFDLTSIVGVVREAPDYARYE